jgi:phosphatidylinositol-3-phosphatase
VNAGPSGLCDECGSPIERGQRYCLGCGARIGSRSPLLAQLLPRVHGQHAAEAAPSAVARRPTPALGLTLPPPRVSALLVLVFLGFGVILGGAAGSRVDDTLAASARSPLRLILPQTASSAAPTSTPTSPPSIGESAPTPSTPTRAPSAAGAPAPAPAKAPSKSGKTPAPSSPSSEGGASGSPSAGSSSRLPPIKHVFLIALADQPYASVFGPASNAPYLSQTLERRGELLVRYYAVAHEELANGIALLSGQGPTAETAANCPTYTDIVSATVGAEGQVIGRGCVYPRATQTLAGQLTAKHLTWRAYVEGMDEAGAQSTACGHPALGQADPTAGAQLPGGQSYATFRNPFVYFHSVIDSSTCAADDVGLKKLSSDLADSARTPSFSYIVPDRCHDGSPTPCAPGQAAGPPAADGFLKKVVPEILASKAYKADGLLVLTVDEAPSTGAFADSSSCCGQPQFPNLPAPTGASGSGLPAKGGGEVGALLLSPFVKSGTTNQEQYNHFSLLRTIEDLFGLKHLGYAGASGVGSFGSDLFQAK